MFETIVEYTRIRILSQHYDVERMKISIKAIVHCYNRIIKNDLYR